MNLTIVSNLYPPYARGGAELIAFRLANELYTRGHKISVLTSKPFEGYSQMTAKLSERQIANVYRFFPPNFYHLLNSHKHSFPVRALWHLVDMYGTGGTHALRRILKFEQPDAVLTHNLKGIGLQIVPEIRRQGIRHIHTLHDVQLSVPSGLLISGEETKGLNSGFGRTWYENRVKKIFGSPDVVISPSKYLADFYHDRGFFPESDLRVIPNPAPKHHLSDNIRPKNGVLHLLFAGQLEKHKGILLLLDALLDLDVPYKLHIAGDGSLAEHIADRADSDSRLIYHGFVSLDNLTRLFSICDSVIIPSLCYENSPTIIYEAFQSGVPVIASDIGGVKELVRDGENGFLFTPGDKVGLRKAVTSLAERRVEFAEKAAKIRQGVEHCNIGKYIDQLEEIVSSVEV